MPSLPSHNPSVHLDVLLREETGFAFYDALVIAAAVESECSTLLSEDLQHRQKVRTLTILNPFV